MYHAGKKMRVFFAGMKDMTCPLTQRLACLFMFEIVRWGGGVNVFFLQFLPILQTKKSRSAARKVGRNTIFFLTFFALYVQEVNV